MPTRWLKSTKLSEPARPPSMSRAAASCACRAASHLTTLTPYKPPSLYYSAAMNKLVLALFTLAAVFTVSDAAFCARTTRSPPASSPLAPQLGCAPPAQPRPRRRTS